jgi:hypothetical protein
MSEAASVAADLPAPWLAATAREQMEARQIKFPSFMIISFALSMLLFS